MKIADTTSEVEIKECHWPLAVDLFLKWGHNIDKDTISVDNLNDITPELSAWGIPWRRI